jgi:2-methylisocitrate lyase-like PEP mutase family enzyme
MGFEAAYLTGAGVAASAFGLPDIGLVTASEMAERARTIAEVLGQVPLIADADTGYGAPLNVVRTVRQYESAGVAAIQLEDQAFPKRCGHLPDKELVSQADYLAKLGAALDNRSDALIIARTDARAVLGLEAAIDRANAYGEAGADIIFVEAPESAAEIEQIVRDVAFPLMLNIVQGGLTPDQGITHLNDLGVAIAIYPSNPLMAATSAMVDSLRTLGGSPPASNGTEGPAAFFNLVGLEEWRRHGDKWTVST